MTASSAPDLPASAQAGPPPDIDVLIVGAGISGISMAAHLKMLCKGRSFAIVERRERLGGTWDLFRYPGVRSDSDMYTLGFAFEPWRDDQSIADGQTILAYLDHVVDSRGIRPHIQFNTRMLNADWREAERLWHVAVEDEQGLRTIRARVLYLGAGYYDYDRPHDPVFAGQENFAGSVVHPQFWPAEFDYSGKRVAVIGSGATAVTLVPAMAKQAAHVTMIQRTPTWMGIRPSRDSIAIWLRRLLPAQAAYALTRFKNIRMHSFIFKRARARPDKVGAFLLKATAKALGPAWSARDYTPPYGPWDQRLCLVPDGDLFAAVKAGKASVVTDAIDAFDATGVRLASGGHVDADVIVTATGLRLSLGGGLAITRDGVAADWTQHWFYRSCMFSNVPNLFVVFGYLNAAWTLRADNTARYACQVLNAMEAKGADRVAPVLPEDHAMEEGNPFNFSSGYIQRGMHLMPKSAPHLPWRLNQDYLEDARDFAERSVDDGILAFAGAAA